MSNETGWWIVLLSGLGCYGLKYAGYAMPQRWFARAAVRRMIELLPVALLGALIVVEAVANGSAYDVETARLLGFAAGGVAIWRKAPFIVVVIVAAAVAALFRLA